jgi:hypothetical protein
VLAEAGFSRSVVGERSRSLIDVGFGCGEQTIYLMCDKPLHRYDELWWDARDHQTYFDQYVGITQDISQCHYADERFKESDGSHIRIGRNITLSCANAAEPQHWDKVLRHDIDVAKVKTQETWLLALDSAYHFSPSRWGLIEHAYQSLQASFMAFDLCLSPSASVSQKLILRVVAALMGAPWANFVTPEVYRQKLVDVGYPDDAVRIVDISEHVFAPLAEYMGEQDRRLKKLGFGLGSFQAAKSLFRWWGSTGVVRGVVVVAKHGNAIRNHASSAAGCS